MHHDLYYVVVRWAVEAMHVAIGKNTTYYIMFWTTIFYLQQSYYTELLDS